MVFLGILAHLPQGTIAAMMRATITGMPGELTKVGLNTYIDPRLEGGRFNRCTTKDIVEVEHFRGDEAANNLGQQALMGKVVVSQAGPIAALGAGEQGQILRMALIQKTFGGRQIQPLHHQGYCRGRALQRR
mgnify:CR=1 FL=1